MQIIRMLSMCEISIKRLQWQLLCLLCPAMKLHPLLDVRPMTENDLDAVLTIEQASYSMPWKREHFEHEMAAPHSFPFVAEYTGVVVGYVCLMSLFEEAQILDIAIAPEQRGRGVARLLMDHAVAVSLEKGAELLALEVRASNTAAIKLYEQLDFKRIGIRGRYYEGVEDAILMEKQLKENQ